MYQWNQGILLFRCSSIKHNIFNDLSVDLKLIFIKILNLSVSQVSSVLVILSVELKNVFCSLFEQRHFHSGSGGLLKSLSIS